MLVCKVVVVEGKEVRAQKGRARSPGASPRFSSETSCGLQGIRAQSSACLLDKEALSRILRSGKLVSPPGLCPAVLSPDLPAQAGALVYVAGPGTGEGVISRLEVSIREDKAREGGLGHTLVFRVEGVYFNASIIMISQQTLLWPHVTSRHCLVHDKY